MPVADGVNHVINSGRRRHVPFIERCSVRRLCSKAELCGAVIASHFVAKHELRNFSCLIRSRDAFGTVNCTDKAINSLSETWTADTFFSRNVRFSVVKIWNHNLIVKCVRYE